jgi:predicted 3-demethylubiquinone-9 3-methyltransferase (glyoxalase superfamily)
MIYPCVWHNGTAKEASAFYSSSIRNCKIISSNAMITILSIGEMKMMLLDGGPMYSPNSSISAFIGLSNEDEIEEVYNKLIVGGETLMALGAYPWSSKYGWLKDRYGFSWQIMKMDSPEEDMKVWPSILFANNNYGHAGAFNDRYVKLFPNSAIFHIEKYGPNQPEHAGKIMFSQLMLNGTLMSAMDGPGDHKFDLSEGISLVVDCETQEEIDQYWEGMLEAGGTEHRCGWLKDPFGVWWQVVPSILYELMNNPNTAPKVGSALMKMIKLDINELKEAAFL